MKLILAGECYEVYQDTATRLGNDGNTVARMLAGCTRMEIRNQIIGREQALVLVEAMRENDSVESVVLSGNKIDEDVMSILKDLFENA
eukprot:CAMPEP_0115043092 /NCGR_PEP_ID=MMETSP0216-20121206/46658_1 /TAXON_ID=223996 /ORGANISM="Protocruzia adherens, Strain Boccale" /LENGTH=87 /DNA_ID=CAMNT_0002425337 /DNA_START=438 /DNA_END=697 /DNA_ORIENTATION=-